MSVSAGEVDHGRMSYGLDTMVVETGSALSGGQKQMISIARSLIKDPEILILDDALSAVDAKTEKRIIDNIRQSRKDRTTIIVTHRLSAITHSDVIIVMEDGEILEMGTHGELVENSGWYSVQKYYYQTGGAS